MTIPEILAKIKPQLDNLVLTFDRMISGMNPKERLEFIEKMRKMVEDMEDIK